MTTKAIDTLIDKTELVEKMPLIEKKPEIKMVTLKAKVSEETMKEVENYMRFADLGSDYDTMIEQALLFVIKRDKDYQSLTKKQDAKETEAA
jgi:hypothetical protein